MATDSVLVNGVTTSVANTLETIYIASSDTLIKAVTVTNPTNINASYLMDIVPSDEDTTKPEIPFRVVVRLKTDLAPEVIGQVIPAGGTLRVETSAANSISFRVTGRVLT